MSFTVVLDMLRGLAYLHEMGIMHRDMKPENLLIIGEDLKIADFGAATRYDTKRLQDVAITTVPYRAPELLVYGHNRDKKANYGPEVDIWAVGLVLLCLEFRHYPFPETEPIALLASLLEEFQIPHTGTWPVVARQLDLNYDKKGSVLRKVENESKRKIIKSILCLDAQKRPTARKLLKTFSRLLL